MVATIQDGVILPAGPVHETMSHDFCRDLFRFMFFVLCHQHPHRNTVIQLGEQLFIKHVRVIGNQDIAAFQDAAFGAVVLLQLDHVQAREILLQPHQILWLCATPGIDRLIVITDHGKAGALANQQFHQLVLAGIGVLVFIDQQVTDAVLPLFPHFGIGF